jgi:hypothetical protein
MARQSYSLAVRDRLRPSRSQWRPAGLPGVSGLIARTVFTRSPTSATSLCGSHFSVRLRRPVRRLRGRQIPWLLRAQSRPARSRSRRPRRTAQARSWPLQERPQHRLTSDRGHVRRRCGSPQANTPIVRPEISPDQARRGVMSRRCSQVLRRLSIPARSDRFISRPAARGEASLFGEVAAESLHVRPALTRGYQVRIRAGPI